MVVWRIKFRTEDGRTIRWYDAYKTKKRATEVAQAWVDLGKVANKTTLVSYEVSKEEW